MENTDLAKRVWKQVTEFPESFQMATWGYRDSCNTVACLAGHAMLLSGYSITGGLNGRYTRPDGTTVVNFGREAQKLLGMSHEERFQTAEEGDIFMDFFRGAERFQALLGE